jgi:hypothetical protein
MAPTQSTILTTFLLPPAPLPALISLNTFTALFPRAQQSSPLIKTLYRDLQRQRATVVDFVTRNIEDECKSGNEQRRAVVRARRNMEKEEGDEEIDVERLVIPFPLFSPRPSAMRNGNDSQNSSQARPHIFQPRIHTPSERYYQS